jgi:hypothetical protein
LGSDDELELERASRGERAASVNPEDDGGGGGVAVGLNGQRGNESVVAKRAVGAVRMTCGPGPARQWQRRVMCGDFVAWLVQSLLL